MGIKPNKKHTQKTIPKGTLMSKRCLLKSGGDNYAMCLYDVTPQS